MAGGLAVAGLTGCDGSVVVEASDLTGTVQQLREADQTLTDSGSISFVDDEAVSIDAVSVEPVSVLVVRDDGTGDPARTPAAPEGSLHAVLTPAGPTGQPDVVTWTYTVDNELVRGLRHDEHQLEVFRITVGDGTHTRAADVAIVIDGDYDPVRVLCTVSGPDQVILDYNDPTPSTWDATGCYDSPDGYGMNYIWTGASSVGLSGDIGAALIPNEPSKSIRNDLWGFNAVGRIGLVVFDDGPGQPTPQYVAQFFVTDDAG